MQLLTLPSHSITPADLPEIIAPALYVHIPFCFHKCHYCDFYSITHQGEDRMERFVELMLAEAELWGESRAGPTPVPRTIFLGGGTPTLLPPKLMRLLIDGLRSRLDLSQVDEWTCECNPATVRESYGRDYLAMLHDAGVNRLSFGAQSFDKADLKMLERHHDPADVPANLALAREAGFSRLNVDLIYAVPGQTLAGWQQTLETAIGLGTEHLSCYGLTYEANTPMAVRKRMGSVLPTGEELELQMFHHTRQRLAETGRPAYEVSNYSNLGAECRHNLAYWRGESYIALGPSGASHVAGTRWKNRPHLGEWERAIEAGRLPATDVEKLSPQQRAGELAMLRLRLSAGIEFADFADRTGRDARIDYADQFERYGKAGLIDVNDQRAKLTERGWDLADAIAGELLAD